MSYEYSPTGVCAQKMQFDVNDGIVKDLKIVGGCAGNGVGIARLVEGMKVSDVIERLESVRCGGRPSSCPAQLAQALRAVNN
ncbi:MAG: TIGR03905 family TSCPD domain-containing protein [Oscillospiraceae bacterium]|nr:TIGR03905 family TSCPD domain-containing protein [Oscillospiraceae bacterium]